MATGNRKLYATAPSYLTLLLPFVHSTSFFLLLFLVSLVLFVKQITTRTTTTITSCPRQHFSSTSNSKWQTDWNVLFKKNKEKNKEISRHFHIVFIVVSWFAWFWHLEYATGYYTDQEKKCLGIQPDLTQNAGGNGGVSGSANSSAYCEYTYSEPTTSGTGSKSGALTPVITFLFVLFLWAKLIKQFLFYGS